MQLAESGLKLRLFTSKGWGWVEVSEQVVWAKTRFMESIIPSAHWRKVCSFLLFHFLQHFWNPV